MGPIGRYFGPLVPKETLIWQDPVPAVDHPLITEQNIAALLSVGIICFLRTRRQFLLF
jgi:catalase (peroxidase I)